jgi:hypothetical protein
MRLISRAAAPAALLMLLGAASPACWAQKVEFGFLGGFGYYTNNNVTAPSGDGTAGFKPGPYVGVFVGHNMYPKIGGELRYAYRPSDLKVSSGGTEAKFSGEAHVIHYDFLYHFAPVESAVRPYNSGGGGVKIYRGTGEATVSQPLSNLALLTNTYETAGLGSVGAGVKVNASPRLGFRVEFRDFITPFPKQVVAPAPNANITGALHDLVVMGGITFLF